ncbi:MAG: hypothetical protein VX772_10940, partial [Bacteroidota bacterium]|nr:hypothetical protein [Bacteroidota bacterium]
WKTSYEIPKSWIEESWNMGYSITSATYGNGLWATCVSKNANLGLQSWKTATEWPIDWIRGKANDGYKITTIAYGDNRWFVVMSNSSSISYNTSITNYTDLPIDWILDKIRGIN